jgi:hypothetical protein
MGATVPIGGIFRQRLGIETVFFSFATSDEDYHAPDEFFRLERLRDGVQAWIRYLSLLGQHSSDLGLTGQHPQPSVHSASGLGAQHHTSGQYT